jgi:hypothetical protein
MLISPCFVACLAPCVVLLGALDGKAEAPPPAKPPERAAAALAAKIKAYNGIEDPSPVLRWLRIHRAWGLPHPPALDWVVRLDRLALVADDFAGPELFFHMRGVSWRSKVDCLAWVIRRGDAYGCEKVLKVTRMMKERAEAFLERDLAGKKKLESWVAEDRAVLASGGKLSPKQLLRHEANRRGLVTYTERERRWREVIAHRVREEQAFTLVYRLARALRPGPVITDFTPPKGR